MNDLANINLKTGYENGTHLSSTSVGQALVIPALKPNTCRRTELN
jgi:hypothetical protein